MALALLLTYVYTMMPVRSPFHIKNSIAVLKTVIERLYTSIHHRIYQPQATLLYVPNSRDMETHLSTAAQPRHHP